MLAAGDRPVPGAGIRQRDVIPAGRGHHQRPDVDVQPFRVRIANGAIRGQLEGARRDDIGTVITGVIVPVIDPRITDELDPSATGIHEINVHVPDLGNVDINVPAAAIQRQEAAERDIDRVGTGADRCCQSIHDQA